MTNKLTTNSILQNIILFLAVIWLVFIIDFFLPLEIFGLKPRSLSGLPGILAMPFLHGNFGHIISNSVPLIVLLSLLAGTRKNSLGIITSISVLGGSLLVFGLAAYLIVHGIRTKSLPRILLSVGVAFVYGTTLFSGVLPNQAGISWDGHLFGAIAGGLVGSAFLR